MYQPAMHHLTQIVVILSKSGEIAEKAHDEIGPSYKGVLLQTHLQPLRDVNQAVVRQTIHAPYWLTDKTITL